MILSKIKADKCVGGKEIDVIDEVVESFGNKDPGELVAITSLGEGRLGETLYAKSKRDSYSGCGYN